MRNTGCNMRAMAAKQYPRAPAVLFSRLARISQCAVKRLEFPAGVKPARQGSLQPEAVGAAGKVTNLSEPLMVGVA